MKTYRPHFGSKGYTLAETVVVLFLLATLAGVVLIYGGKVEHHRQVEQFFTLLAGELYSAQQRAVVLRQPTGILFQPERHAYVVVSGGAVIEERKYPPFIQVRPLTMGHYILYETDGNIRWPGTIEFLIGEERYRLVFQLGKGRFRLEK